MCVFVCGLSGYLPCSAYQPGVLSSQYSLALADHFHPALQPGPMTAVWAYALSQCHRSRCHIDASVLLRSRRGSDRWTGRAVDFSYAHDPCHVTARRTVVPD